MNSAWKWFRTSYNSFRNILVEVWSERVGEKHVLSLLFSIQQQFDTLSERERERGIKDMPLQTTINTSQQHLKPHYLNEMLEMPSKICVTLSLSTLIEVNTCWNHLQLMAVARTTVCLQRSVLPTHLPTNEFSERHFTLLIVWDSVFLFIEMNWRKAKLV